METKDNVIYMDDYRRNRWLRELNRVRELGGIAVFNQEYAVPAEVVAFPVEEGEPDGAA